MFGRKTKRKLRKKTILGLSLGMLLVVVFGAVVFVQPLREKVDGFTGGVATKIYMTIMGIFKGGSDTAEQ